MHRSQFSRHGFLPAWGWQAATLLLAIAALGGCHCSSFDSSPEETAVPRPGTGSRTAADPPSLPNAPLPGQQQVSRLQRAPRQGDWFEDVTERAGVRFAYRDGHEAGFYTLLETVGGGAALFDYDRNGQLDLLLIGGGQISGPPIELSGLPLALFRNQGQWQFADVAVEAGLKRPEFYTHGVAVGDFDSDGFADLLITGYGGCRLYRNQGDGSFLDVTESSGIACPAWNTAAAWVDVDGDGHLDLYVVTYAQWEPDAGRVCRQEQLAGPVRDTCAPSLFDGQRDFLWRNRGDGTFADLTEAAGLVPANRGLGIVAADLDQDGWMDLFVVNDVHENQLYFGGPQFPLDSAGVLAGVAFSPAGEREGSMGVDLGDIDGDGRPDVFYTNFSGQDNSLLKQFEPRGFLNVTDLYGLLGVSRRWVGFGTALADFDNNGWLDLFVANGHVRYAAQDSPYFQPPQLFRNQQGRRYEDLSADGGPYFSAPQAGRGAAVGDLDNDGTLDLVVVHQNDPVVLLRNRHPADHWVRIELRGTVSNRDAVGARVTASYGDRLLTRWLRAGGGYLSHFDSRILLPAADSQPLTVTVRWPSGAAEMFGELALQQNHVLVEGTGAALAKENKF